LRKQHDNTRPPPRVRRAYYDCRYGQLHLHNAIPAGGGFDELTPVICIHGADQTGRVFLPWLAPLGSERSVYALDLPGAGESDPAPGVDLVDAASHAVMDFVDAMRIRRFDLVAREQGCEAALKVLAQRAAAVRRAVLLGGAGDRAGSAAIALPLAEADRPDFGARLVSLLAVPA
jgi:pyruvate dehydrogenase E2 component (dihydrolipoamide acetyltransferase)